MSRFKLEIKSKDGTDYSSLTDCVFKHSNFDHCDTSTSGPFGIPSTSTVYFTFSIPAGLVDAERVVGLINDLTATKNFSMLLKTESLKDCYFVHTFSCKEIVNIQVEGTSKNAVVTGLVIDIEFRYSKVNFEYAQSAV